MENNFYYIQDNDDDEFEKLIDAFNKNFFLKTCRVDIEYVGKVYYVINQNKLHKYCMNGIDFISNEIKEKIKLDNNFNVIIHSSHESIDEINLNILKNYIVNNELSEKKFILYSNCANFDEIQSKLKTKFKHKKSNYLSYIKINDMKNSTNSIFKKNKEGGKFFMTFNKEDKQHRYALLIFLRKYNMLHDTNWSFLPTLRRNINKNKLQLILNDVNHFEDEIDYFTNLNHKYSDYESVNSYSIENVLKQTMVEDVKNYENSYINLTTESVFEDRENVIHITEKSFKPFFYYQFPLILASENHIKKMKELYDLDFFEDIIDCTYDSFVNDKERFSSYCKEVQKINKNKEFFVDFYQSNQERFENNKKKIINIINFLHEDYQYFLNLI